MNLFHEFCLQKISYYVNPQPIEHAFHTNGFNLLFMNVNRLTSDTRRENFQLYLSEFKILFDVIVLVETFNKDTLSALKLPFYNDYHNIRNREGGGVSIYVLNKHTSVLKLSETDNENQILVVRLNEIAISIMGVYKPPHSDDKEFIEFLDKFLYTQSRQIIVGDMNLNMFQKNNNIIKFYKEMITSNGYAIMNKLGKDLFTRQSNSVNTLIDHAMTNALNFKYKFSLLDNSFSDHRHLILSANTAKQSNTSKNVITKYNNELIIKDVTEKINLNMNFKDFHEDFKSIVSEHATEVIKPTPKITLRKPWFSNKLLSIKKLRDKFYKKSKLYPNNNLLVEQFVYYRNELDKNIVVSKKNYYSDRLDSAKCNNKQTWAIFRELMFNEIPNQPSNENYTIKVNLMLTDDNQIVAEAFNEFFSTVGENISKNLPNLTGNPTVIEKRYTCSLSEVEPTNHREISNIIDNLKTNTAKGLDNISAKLIKKMKSHLTDFLVEKVNECLNIGIFPDSLKIARVKPIFKSDDPKIISNYRPISVLPAFSKIFETVIKDRLENYLTENNIIHTNQYGFKKNSSTSAACINLLKHIYENLNSKVRRKTGALFIDIAKAFDSISHEILIEKLKKIGIKGAFLKLLANYINNRSQVVVINGKVSKCRLITAGIAQGSLLGPVLFLIYINDIFDLQLHAKIQLFADDAILIFGALTYEILKQYMANDLDQLNLWLNKNKLSLNLKKTEYLIFYLRNTDTKEIFNQLPFNSEIIKRVDKAEYLGLILNTSLSFADHVNKVKKKINPIIGIIGKIRNFLYQDDLKRIYFSYVHSQINYCLPIYATASAIYMNELYTLQKKCIKFVFKLNRLHPSSLVFRDGILPVPVMIKYENCILFYKIKTNKLKFNFQLVKRGEISGRTTRQSHLYESMFTKLSFVKDSFFGKGVVEFNNLPEHIKNQPNLHSFKVELKKICS